MQVLLDHPSIIHSKEINKICSPLNALDISYFSHVHVDSEKKFTVIGNNPDFIELYYKREYFNADLHTTTDLNAFGRYVIWNNMTFCGKTLGMELDAAELGILHTFTVIEKDYNNGHNFYHFSTHINNVLMNQSYLANIDILKKFIRYFTEKVNQSTKLSKAHQLKIAVDQNAAGYTLNTGSDLFSAEKRSQFLSSLKSDSDCLSRLSKRERDCLELIVRGKTAREIGDLLGLTKRTVEFYIANIKSKLYVSTKSELIEKMIDFF